MTTTPDYAKEIETELQNVPEVFPEVRPKF